MSNLKDAKILFVKFGGEPRFVTTSTLPIDHERRKIKAYPGFKNATVVKHSDAGLVTSARELREIASGIAKMRGLKMLPSRQAMKLKHERRGKYV